MSLLFLFFWFFWLFHQISGFLSVLLHSHVFRLLQVIYISAVYILLYISMFFYCSSSFLYFFLSFCLFCSCSPFISLLQKVCFMIYELWLCVLRSLNLLFVISRIVLHYPQTTTYQQVGQSYMQRLDKIRMRTYIIFYNKLFYFMLSKFVPVLFATDLIAQLVTNILCTMCP